MKKLILLFLPLLSGLANAEELKFVTVLSSPVGSFNKLETVDPTTPAKSPTINFCTSIGTGGTVALKGASKPDVETMNLSQNTTLGRAGTGEYVLNKITMKNGGSLKGSRLLASTVQINQPTAGKSDKLYTDTLTVAGAKAGKLYVNGKDSYIESGAADPGMMWSNQYQSDKACGDKCKDQYLLKEKGSAPVGCPSGQYESNGICCPVGQLSKDGKTCVYAYKPERVNVGILVDCHNTYRFLNKSTCARTGTLSYFVGGKLPNVAAGEGCTAHHAFYNGGRWWDGGEHQGYSIGRCSASVSDQDFCDSNCKNATCTAKCIINETYPDTCGVYSCSNGRHCDNSEGSGLMLRCVRA